MYLVLNTIVTSMMFDNYHYLFIYLFFYHSCNIHLCAFICVWRWNLTMLRGRYNYSVYYIVLFIPVFLCTWLRSSLYCMFFYRVLLPM